MGRIVHTVLLFIKIYIYLIVFDIQLRSQGFQSLFPKYIKKYPVRQRNIEKKPEAYARFEEKVNQLMYLTDVACTYFPLKAECLHRSFVAYRLLRQSCGLPVELVIGVKKFPFSAHAWLICNGTNINESEEITCEYKILLKSDM